MAECRAFLRTWRCAISLKLSELENQYQIFHEVGCVLTGLVAPQKESLLDSFYQFRLSFSHSADGSDRFGFILHGFQQSLL